MIFIRNISVLLILLLMIQGCDKKQNDTKVPGDLRRYFCVSDIQAWIYRNRMTNALDSFVLNSVTEGEVNRHECDANSQTIDVSFTIVNTGHSFTDKIESGCTNEKIYVTEGLTGLSIECVTPVTGNQNYYDSLPINGIMYYSVLMFIRTSPISNSYQYIYYARDIGKIRMLRILNTDTVQSYDLVRAHMILFPTSLPFH